ncbi:hypothetical protein CRUP_001391, partial [Coryphaenoides rupestris]
WKRDVPTAEWRWNAPRLLPPLRTAEPPASSRTSRAVWASTTSPLHRLVLGLLCTVWFWASSTTPLHRLLLHHNVFYFLQMSVRVETLETK